MASLVLALTSLWALPALAALEVAGVRFDDQTSLASQALVLNGAGVRVKMIIKVYAVGLYVPRKETAPAAILNQAGPKSIRIVMLRSVSGEKLANALTEGIEDNVSPADLLSLQPRIDELEAAMRSAGEAVKGAQIQLDYLPGIGTRVTMGGKPLGKDIAGEDFYRALLKIWLGEHPSDRSLKGDLLGQS
ncbi:MAG: chalcone isomerase family protein [Aquabacterium sp.]|uniref:chalcone isomerase family protein n=1 Tax=Aquabacterium sp. TaxID=1872578 RepID=UPI0025BE49D1|nr:chalcone isomerase family protein [Aquabacterium sp.]MBI5925810.1 chalcone isomerase family protein [Aquabacterium sp.]